MRDNSTGGALTETSLLILLGFFNNNYGYGVMKWIKKVTNGRVVLGMGTLYGAIDLMIERELLQEKGEMGRRKLYGLTQKGLDQIFLEIGRLEELLKISRSIIKP